MKQGLTLKELAAAVEDTQAHKRDYLADTQRLSFRYGALELGLDGGAWQQLPVTDLAHDQIANRVGIPTRYYRRLREEATALLDHNVNHWFAEQPTRQMVRTLNGKVRAFLSDRYRPLDNYDLMENVLPVLAEQQLTVESCQLTEKRLYLKVLAPKMEVAVVPGDVVRAGMVISNSEVGDGTVSVEPLIYRLVCSNGLIAKTGGMRKHHVGKQADFEGAVEFYRDETKEADDRAFWMKVVDTVRGALTEAGFASLVDAMRTTMGYAAPEAQAPQIVEVTRRKLGWSEVEADGVLVQYCKEGGRSLYHLVNAVTAYSQEVDDYDAATRLERDGGTLMSLPLGECRALGYEAQA